MTNYRKIADEDPNFADFMSIVTVNIMMNSRDFDPMIALLYSLYQSGLNTDQAASTTLMMIKMNKADE